MQLSDGSRGQGMDTAMTAAQVGRQLGHPLAALTGSREQPLVQYGYAGAGAWPQLDNGLLTYADPVVYVETALRARNPLELDEAARGALSGFRLNVEMRQSDPADLEAWIESVLAKGAALRPQGNAPTVAIDGSPFVPVVVDDGAYRAWAVETDVVRVTVAGRREHLERVELGWLRP